MSGLPGSRNERLQCAIEILQKYFKKNGKFQRAKAVEILKISMGISQTLASDYIRTLNAMGKFREVSAFEIEVK